MEFKNLTPFDALAFTSLDRQDRPCHIVAMSVGYQLQALYPQAPAHHPDHAQHQALVMDREPLPLCLADAHWGDAAHSSLRQESDLVPFKPRCDVLVTGHAHAREPHSTFEVGLQVQQGPSQLLDKRLQVTGPRVLQRGDGFGAWLREGLNPTRAYSLSTPERVRQVPLRYELAYGGACVVANPKAAKSVQTEQGQHPEHLINEVCYQNPLGAGWMVQGYLDALAQTPQGLPDTLRAPQIMRSGQYFERLVQTAQSGAMDAKQMAQLDYKLEVAGLGPLNKAWAPRLALAGTYDDEWLTNRHPMAPKDFDHAYWNGAPRDQQIPWPDLTQGVTLRTENLRPGGGPLRVKLPAHRAFVLADLGGVRLPLPMSIDTLTLDSDTLQLRLVWRVSMLHSMQPETLELRFEVDPKAPLVKYKNIEDPA